ncbi:hypothetical protein [Terriglobus saanensis]|uniref:Uncharacterized protein n=1 Tax=Terriglobus saanensis (strain ATCC BAA-1853 / DSM 23119 / SP1PR4) TaxID=401053 RepID=E8V1J8_TERSS|nr:hypothetical protein [Terriglobus saanensis]ADV81193.1 hypothetical protein AciPR4_0358 [Terriglobus saanensis SP1PR4]
MTLQLTQQREFIVEGEIKSGALVQAVNAGFVSGIYEGDPFEAALEAIRHTAASRSAKYLRHE